MVLARIVGPGATAMRAGLPSFQRGSLQNFNSTATIPAVALLRYFKVIFRDFPSASISPTKLGTVPTLVTASANVLVIS